MDTRARLARVEEFAQRCRESGIPLTVQRRAILETVLESADHPTADAVHEALTRRIPGVSRTTVYRTLETLVELDLVARVCHPGRGVRFDPRVDTHHHLICQRCGAVVDLDDARLDSIPWPDVSERGFEVVKHGVQLLGICQDCREDKEEK